MKLTFLHSIIFITTTLSVVDGDITHVCDVEGSGIDDCSSEQYCCEQSVCDILYGSDIKTETEIDVEYDTENNLRCCDIIESNVSTLPSDCKLCTKCCDEEERKQTPLPSHCSKCQKCSHSTRNAFLTQFNGNQKGKNLNSQ